MKRVLLAMAVFFPSMAFAEMSYRYVEVEAEFGNAEILGDEYDTTSVSGEVSFEAHKNVALLASVSTDDIDLPSPLEASGSGFGFAALGHTPINEKVDLQLGLGVHRVDVEVSDGVTTFKDDDTGTAILFGIRGIVTDGIEAEGRVVSSDSFGSRSESYSVMARAAFNKSISGSVGYSWGDDYSGVGVALRVNY